MRTANISRTTAIPAISRHSRSSRIKLCSENNVRNGRTCEAIGCHLPVYKVSIYCKRHHRAREYYGDARGKHIFKRELRPFRRIALKYIIKYRDHEAIAAALRWLQNLIYNSGTPPSHQSRHATPHQRSLRYLARLAKGGVRPEEALSLVVAMYMYRDHARYAFISDHHFNAMLAHHFCRLVPDPWMQVYRAGVGGRKYDRLSVGLRKYLSAKINGAIGVVAVGCSRAILKAETMENGLLRGVNIPIAFDKINNTRTA